LANTLLSPENCPGAVGLSDANRGQLQSIAAGLQCLPWSFSEVDARLRSEQTIYTWRKRLGSFQANDVRRLKQLDAENARLKPKFVSTIVDRWMTCPSFSDHD
jgi:hypothetical protein